MANKVSIQFNVMFVADGTSTTLTVNMASDPVIYYTQANQGILSPLFNAPGTGVVNMQEATGNYPVTSWTYNTLLKTLSVTLSVAPPANVEVLLLGIMLY